MSHHGSDPFETNEEREKRLKRLLAETERRALLRDLLDTTGFIGATGMHPDGKLNADDEGGLQFRYRAENGKVVVDFGKPVHWLGMTPQQAADFASDIMKLARAAARAKGESVAFKIG